MFLLLDYCIFFSKKKIKEKEKEKDYCIVEYTLSQPYLFIYILYNFMNSFSTLINITSPNFGS